MFTRIVAASPAHTCHRFRADFDEAIRLQHSFAEAYLARGTAYEAKIGNDKAEANLAEARRLGFIEK